MQMNEKAKKRMRIMLISMAVLFGVIFIYKGIKGLMFSYFMSHVSNVVTVSAMTVGYSTWMPELKAVGSLRAIRGVDVTTELAGLVRTIDFVPGATVKKDEVLVQLDADPDTAKLRSLQANADLAKVTYNRDKAQYAVHAVSKATLDSDAANLRSLLAQVDEQAAIVSEKTIRAPFSGRLGISAVNPGQYVNPGDKVVTLQQLDPIYVDFYVPQQQIDRLSLGQSVKLTVDSFPKETFSGKITTINPIVDVATRNVEVEATIENPKLQLVPGMFAIANINKGHPKRYLTLPQSAVSFNSYGDLVYVINESGKDRKGNPILTVKQHLVTTGATRGDQIAVLQGLKEGERVVTSGQLKLKNDTAVAINNDVVPENKAAPVVKNES